MVQASRIRKNRDLSLILLAALLAPAGLKALTPVQMGVFTLVAMFYIPFVATISALVKEFGGKKASFITLFEVAFAIILGGAALRLLTLVTQPRITTHPARVLAIGLIVLRFSISERLFLR